ncbi:hypothetical protein VIGAN_05239700, partial [Vigna angularis var. angularis]
SSLAEVAPPTHEGSPHTPWTHITTPTTLSNHWNTWTSLRQVQNSLKVSFLPTGDPVHLTEYLCWTFCTKATFVSGNRLQGCCKRLPHPFLSTLTHPLQTLLLQLIRGHPTLLGHT